MRTIALVTILLLASAASSVRSQGQESRTGRGDARGRGGEERIQADRLQLDMEQAARLIANRRYAEAVAVLEILRKRYPEQEAVADLLARSYLLAGRAGKAIEVLEVLSAARPDRFSYIRDLGQAYLDLGEKERAIEIWESVLGDDESQAGYFGIVANLEKESGLYEEALGTLRRSLRFDRHYDRYAMDTIKLERLLGRPADAFRDGLEYLARTKDPSLEQASFLFDVFREAGRGETLLMRADSMAGAGERAAFFRKLHALLAVEADDYGPARRLVSLETADGLREEELFGFILFVSSMEHKRDDGGFRSFLADLCETFLGRYGDSPGAPYVMLMTAREKRERATGAFEEAGAFPQAGAALRDSLLAEVLSLCDRALALSAAGPYNEGIILFEASVQLDDMRRPAEALGTLDRARYRTRETMREAAMLQMRALLAVGRWREAESRLDVMARRPDTTIAAIGSFGVGKLRFLEGRYDEAVDTLSGFAAQCPWSPLANDALELAVLVKGSMSGDRGALDLYRSALFDYEGGRFEEAGDSLELLEERYGESILMPSALHLRALSRMGEGRRGEAGRALNALAERFPLHELAPRALEMLAGMAEREDPAAAAERYGEIISRYPDDPFLERVRSRYVALRKELDGGGTEERR